MNISMFRKEQDAILLFPAGLVKHGSKIRLNFRKRSRDSLIFDISVNDHVEEGALPASLVTDLVTASLHGRVRVMEVGPGVLPSYVGKASICWS